VPAVFSFPKESELNIRGTLVDTIAHVSVDSDSRINIRLERWWWLMRDMTSPFCLEKAGGKQFIQAFIEDVSDD
jgi:hypothetical protein